MLGRFELHTRSLFCMNLGGVDMHFAAMALWDAAPEGRVGLIIDRSPQSQRMFLCKYSLNFNLLRCQVAVLVGITHACFPSQLVR